MKNEKSELQKQVEINLALEQLEHAVRVKAKQAIQVVYDFAQDNIDWEIATTEECSKWQALVILANVILHP